MWVRLERRPMVDTAAMEYAISVRGALSPSVAAAFEEFELSTDHGATVLRGDIVDRAALYGVINRIERFGLDLVDLHALRRGEAGQAPDSGEPLDRWPSHDRTDGDPRAATHEQPREDHP